MVFRFIRRPNLSLVNIHKISLGIISPIISLLRKWWIFISRSHLKIEEIILVFILDSVMLHWCLTNVNITLIKISRNIIVCYLWVHNLKRFVEKSCLITWQTGWCDVKSRINLLDNNILISRSTETSIKVNF